MKKLPFDIEDSEIRIISNSNVNYNSKSPKPKRRHKIIIAVAAGLLALGVIALCLVLFLDFAPEAEFENPDGTVNYLKPDSINAVGETPQPIADVTDNRTATLPEQKGFVSVADTTVAGNKFLIFNPNNLTPRLYVGADILDDPNVNFVVQAADVRRDNGKIVGAFVLKGELLSKGQSKSGYCAIIDGELSIGVAETTPLLEKALETNGYFFRQYPLVVSNQVIENKPKNKSLRKALADLNGDIVVIMSLDKLTFHDFSQALVDMGVSNAIYLVGSTSYGFAKDIDGQKIEFGKRVQDPYPYSNYIVW